MLDTLLSSIWSLLQGFDGPGLFFVMGLLWVLPFLAGLGLGAVLWRHRADFRRFELPSSKRGAASWRNRIP